MSISENIKAVEAKVAAAAERSGRKREDIQYPAAGGEQDKACGNHTGGCGERSACTGGE